MKNFQNYTPDKYAGPDFQLIEPGIYKTKCPYDNDEIFVTSLSFEMEPDTYGEEDGSPQNMPQIPIEGILDDFNVFVSDFYDDLNDQSKTTCYQEFASSELADIQNLRTLIGKRFYAEPYTNPANGKEYYHMILQ